MELSLSAEDVERAIERSRKRQQAQEEPVEESASALASASTSVTTLHSGGDVDSQKPPKRQKRSTGSSSDLGTPSGNASLPLSKGPSAVPASADAAPALAAAPQFLFNGEHAEAVLAMPAAKLKPLAKKLGISVPKPTAPNFKVAILRFAGTAARIEFNKGTQSFTFANLQKQDFSKPAAPAHA